MLLIDVNILVNAHREGQTKHKEFQVWLEKTVASGQVFSIPSLVRSAFLRIVTNSRIYPVPTPLEEALSALENLQSQPNFLEVNPGDRHWKIFTDLCRRAEAKGNLVADAYLAALAIESGGEWVTADRDYARFPGLKWRHPLDAVYRTEDRFPPTVQEPRSSTRASKRSKNKK